MQDKNRTRGDKTYSITLNQSKNNYMFIMDYLYHCDTRLMVKYLALIEVQYGYMLLTILIKCQALGGSLSFFVFYFIFTS